MVVSASLTHTGNAEVTRTEALTGKKKRDSLVIFPVYMLLGKATAQWLTTGKGLCFLAASHRFSSFYSLDKFYVPGSSTALGPTWLLPAWSSVTTRKDAVLPQRKDRCL